MTSKLILMADNNPTFLETRRPFLEKAGYTVITASSPKDAAAILEKDGADLALLDLRLEDDDDQEDTSGLELARKFGQKLPIIILTAFPTWDTVKSALCHEMEGLSPAVDYLSKEDGAASMVQTVNLSIELPRFKKNLLDGFQVESSQALHESVQKKDPAEITERLQKTLARAEREFFEQRKAVSDRAEKYQRIAMIAQVVGIAAIFAAAILFLLGKLSLAAVSGVASAIAEAISVLCTRPANRAAKEVAESYEKLQDSYKASQLISFCDTIINEAKREEMKILIIKKLIGAWLA